MLLIFHKVESAITVCACAHVGLGAWAPRRLSAWRAGRLWASVRRGAWARVRLWAPGRLCACFVDRSVVTAGN